VCGVWVNWDGGGTRKIHGVKVGTVRNGKKRVKRIMSEGYV